MKKTVFTLFAIILLGLLASCSHGDSMRIGFTPLNGPITLFIDSEGPKIEFNGKISSPIGTFELSYSLNDVISNFENSFSSHHNTYIEIINRHENNRVVLSLTDVGESVEWECKNSKIRLENQRYCTLVTVESDEISNLLHKEKGPGFKPDFPETPLEYFYLSKLTLKKVNWGVSSFADLMAEVFLGTVLFFAALLDVMINIFLFMFR